jgi:predicted 3-demethylubiquinone-9 3-methyltransferase (glyoxalase superfamily)
MADHYCAIFPNSRITGENPQVVSFVLNGSRFMALNGGIDYAFNPSVSFVVECETQAEIDHYWEALGAGGTYQPCGWLQDQFGLSWQIVPKVLGELMGDPERAPRVVAAFMKMQKFDLQALLDA